VQEKLLLMPHSYLVNALKTSFPDLLSGNHVPLIESSNIEPGTAAAARLEVIAGQNVTTSSDAVAVSESPVGQVRCTA
jgi:hypothetical protein